GQQWGEEHGLEIDQFAADRIEVMKGPASLQYGSDALGGIVNILEPITPAPGEMRGVLNSQYSSNNRLYGGSVMAEGNRNGFVARFRASGKSAASFRTPVERVYNSGFDELSQSLMVGANKKWGYSHFQLSHWQSDLGLTEGARNEAGEFVDDEGNVIPKDVLDSRKISQPSQLIEHTKISSTNNLILGKSQLRINAGWQLNQRQEFEESPDAPSIHMRLRTFTNDIRYYPMLGKGWEVASGASFMLQEHQNLGQEYLIPDYEQQDAGGFVTSKKNFEKTTVEVGVRIDHRKMNWSTTVSAGDTLFKGDSRDFQALSGSIGFTHAFNHTVSVKASAGRGFRAPSASELTANGLHEGTFRYEIGDRNLAPEKSIQLDLGTSISSTYFSVDFSAFINSISDYIYYRNLDNEKIEADNDSFLVYRYTQGRAKLQGGELSLDIHPLKNLHFENTIALVISENSSISTPLPFTPPIRTTHSLSYDWNLNTKSTARVTLEAVNNFAQNRIDVFETVTDGYWVWNTIAGIDFKNGRHTAMIFLRCDNMLNKQ
ncbi:MAG: TonB-dependent receptor, partial [Flavobacteriales bacterium]